MNKESPGRPSRRTWEMPGRGSVGALIVVPLEPFSHHPACQRLALGGVQFPPPESPEWAASIIRFAALEPSERKERHQGDCSHCGADDEGAHYQLVHGAMTGRRFIVGPFSKALDQASARTDAQIPQRLHPRRLIEHNCAAEDTTLYRLHLLQIAHDSFSPRHRRRCVGVVGRPWHR
jgi:hypothetical protein